MVGEELRQIKSREDMIRYFDGYASERVEEISERKLNRPLVKTQLLETVAHDNGDPEAGLEAILERNVHLTPLEAGLYAVLDTGAGGVGFAERLNARVVAIYSAEDVRTFVSWVHPYVERNSNLDYVWLSGLTFNGLWDYVVQTTEPQRYVWLSFSHERIYDIDRTLIEEDDNSEVMNSTFADENITERRATTSRLADRVGELQGKLGPLQTLYSPFHAISRLRMPSSTGRGGHDFYDDGRVTNRSGNFRDHRSQLLFVSRIYERLLRATEEQAWYSVESTNVASEHLHQFVGAPVVISFHEPVNALVFKHWVSTTFERKRNRFRLWGKPTWLGPTKVHVHGVDRHLWQPLFLELTAKGCTLILPKGTCGNVVHRFVTNIQRYLDPAAQAFVGNKNYRQLVEDSIREALRGPQPD